MTPPRKPQLTAPNRHARAIAAFSLGLKGEAAYAVVNGLPKRKRRERRLR